MNGVRPNQSTELLVWSCNGSFRAARHTRKATLGEAQIPTSFRNDLPRMSYHHALQPSPIGYSAVTMPTVIQNPQ